MSQPLLNLKVKRLYEDAILPKKAHPTDACFDIYAYFPSGKDSTMIIPPGKCLKIQTGFATEIPPGYWAAIFARSGLATKKGLRPAQGVPVIDQDYRGEWIVPLYNDSPRRVNISFGDRIAQFMLLPALPTLITEVDELDDTERGVGGFGSSGA